VEDVWYATEGILYIYAVEGMNCIYAFNGILLRPCVWYRPHGATPTTHILKLPLGLVGNFRGDLSDSVENEWLCAQLMREFGLPIADADILTYGKQTVLSVKRFDRRWIGAAAAHVLRSQFQPKAGQWIARLPQEDFCQATGRPPTDKYEADGGPTSDRHYRLREIHPRHWHELALRIGIPAQFWLNLQSLYDLRTAERSAETKRAVREIEPLDHAEVA
jgi:serine/threonine protein kinase HipA of HipAB toxin-antitoxin module